ncbi:MAG: HTTM domain-containing protein [Planctomycetota bacterium]
MSSRPNDREDTFVGLPARVGRFFFDREVPYGLAAVRIAVPLVLFGDMTRRWPHVRELFSADGATAPLYINYGFPSPVPEFPGAVAVALFTLFLATLLTTAAGWMTRLSASIAFALSVYFGLLDMIGTLSKFTVIATHALLLLSVSESGAVWSVDAWRRGTPPRASAAWPRRLMQLLIGIVYFAAAMTKIQTPEFFSGEQMMYWTLTHLNQWHPLGDELAMHPTVLVLSAYITVVWEAVFLFTAWRGLGRKVMLGLGITFHAMNCLVLGLYFFPMLFFGLYLCFLNEDDVAWFKRGWRNLRLRAAAVTRLLPLPSVTPPALPRAALSPAVFVCGLPLLAGAGAVAEFAADPYDARTGDGKPQLRPVSDGEAAAILAPTEEVRTIDKFFSFTVGDAMFGPYVFRPVDRFVADGGKLHAQAVLQPPHEDFWVECQLRRPDGSIAARRSGLVARERLKVRYDFLLGPEVGPGDYDVVLVIEGEDVAVRPVTVAAE